MSAAPATDRSSATDRRPDRPALAARYDRRRQELVLAAARVLAERGVAETSVADLAREFGLAPAALYHYFDGRGDLIRQICDDLMDPLLAGVDAFLADPKAPEEQLRGLIRIWVEHVLDHRHHLLVFQQLRHVVDHGERWRGVRATRKRFERLVAERLQAVADEGRLRGGDPRIALAALLGMVNHTPQWYSPRGRLSPRAIADGYAELLLTG